MNVKIAIAGVVLIFAIFLFSGCATEESSSTLATETPLASKGVPSASPPGTLGPNETPTNTPQTATPTPSEMPPSAYLPEVPRISVDEVKAKLDAGFNIVIIDSRSKSSYDNSRIPGAISLPLADMAEPYSDLDRYEEIITYCT